MEDVYTVADLARRTGLTQAKVKSALRGVEPALTASDGYFKLYSPAVLRDRLLAVNADVLTAIKVLSRPQDVTTEESA